MVRARVFARPAYVGSLLLICTTLASSVALADVTVRSTTRTQGAGMSMQGETVTYIKGHRMRTELRSGKDVMITLMDIDQRRSVFINGSKGDAFDMTPYMAQQKTLIDDAKTDVQLKAKGTQGQVAGATCENYDMMIRVSAAPGDPTLGEVDVIIQGPACLVKDAPGLADYSAFYLHAAETGFFFGDPRAAKAQPGRERGMTMMYKKMAELGIPYSSQMNIGFKGDGFMAKILEKTAITTQSEVVSVSTETLPDSLFEVPAGIKIKKN